MRPKRVTNSWICSTRESIRDRRDPEWHGNSTLRALPEALDQAHKKGFWPGAFHGISLFVTVKHSR